MNQSPIQAESHSTCSEFERRLEVFHGDADPAVARVYARLRVAAAEIRGRDEWTLSGRLAGPECAFAQTLPLRMPFLTPDRSSEVEEANAAESTGQPRANTLLAEAIAPDPCFWTPDLPFLYRAQVELRSGTRLLSQCERMLGIRRLGIRGKSLFFDGKRFVLRGADRRMGEGESGMDDADQEFARDSWTAIFTSSPDNEICEQASRRGVLLLADLTTQFNDFGPTELVAELHRLAQWPAVAIAVLGKDADISETTTKNAPNLLLAQKIAADEPVEVKPWAQLVFAEVGQPWEFAEKFADCALPIVGVRRLPLITTIQEARAGCDALQRELAFAGDFAGYVV